MKAISIWQPWASLIALGLKQYETRSWPTDYRGPLLIHAGRKVVDWPLNLIQIQFEKKRINHPRQLPRGVILCQVDLIDCQEVTLENRPQGLERQFGDYNIGRFMWRLARPRILEPPVPWRGDKGLFDVDLCKGIVPYVLRLPVAQ